MATPIYRIYRGNLKEAWYQLSKKQQEALLAKVTRVLQEVGGKAVVRCQSDWSTEQAAFFGVEEFPNLEALLKLEETHRELNWHRYVDGETVVGTKAE